MIAVGMLHFRNGRVRITDKAPNIWVSGTPMRGAFLCYQELGPQGYNAGLGYTVTGALSVPREKPNIPTLFGPPLALTEPITHYWCGLPMVADGRMACDLTAGGPLGAEYNEENG